MFAAGSAMTLSLASAKCLAEARIMRSPASRCHRPKLRRRHATPHKIRLQIMSPAGDLDDASRAVEIVITRIGVGLQITAKVFQHRFGMFSAPVGGECEPD